MSTFLGFPRLPSNHHGILVDRCLSLAIAKAPSGFKRFQAVHLSEVYEQSEATEDVQFLADAGDHGWGVFTQNDQMLRMPSEMHTIRAHSTRVFTLTSSQPTDAGKGLLFGRHLISIRSSPRAWWMKGPPRDPVAAL